MCPAATAARAAHALRPPMPESSVGTTFVTRRSNLKRMVCGMTAKGLAPKVETSPAIGSYRCTAVLDFITASDVRRTLSADRYLRQLTKITRKIGQSQQLATASRSTLARVPFNVAPYATVGRHSSCSGAFDKSRTYKTSCHMTGPARAKVGATGLLRCQSSCDWTSGV